jgi:small subunit ribosomal protein S33
MALRRGVAQFTSLFSWHPESTLVGRLVNHNLSALPLPLRPFTSSPTPRLSAQPALSSEESLEQIRSRIFGIHIGNGLRSGRKILSRPLIGQKLLEYYPKNLIKQDPFMLDLQREDRLEKLAKLRRRGKGPPKKGQGRRAMKGKR